MEPVALTEQDLPDLAQLYRQFREEDQAHRRRGIGSKLMRAIEQEALRHECSYVMLITDAGRMEALGFYQNLGYHPDRYRACKKYLDEAAR